MMCVFCSRSALVPTTVVRLVTVATVCACAAVTGSPPPSKPCPPAGFTVRVDPGALGWETEGFIEIYCRHNTSPDTIRRGLERYQEVVAASTVTGDADAIVQVFASDMRHFERVLERIAGEPFVERTKSVLVLSPLLRRFSSGSPT